MTTSSTASVLGKRDVASLFGAMRNRLATPPTRPQLRSYYQRWFPADDVAAAFHTDREVPLSTREFVLRVRPDGQNEDDTLRFRRQQRYEDAYSLRAAICDVQPLHVDVGGAYVDDEGGLGDRATRREFVLDVDINDYDRVCCASDDPNVCERCWTLLRGAAIVGEHLLRSLLGVTRTVWMFSGRRGLHCWVFDRRVLALDNDSRRQMLELLTGPLARCDVHVRRMCAQTYAEYIRGTVTDLDLAIDRAFPRFDSSVSKTTNHLLRMPFSVHGTSGCVVVPIDTDTDKTEPPRLQASKLVDGDADAEKMLSERLRLWKTRLE